MATDIKQVYESWRSISIDAKPPYHAASMATKEAPISESWSTDRGSEACRKASLSSTTIHFSQQDKRQDDILLFFDS
jgi:hypothetical protein